VNLYDDVQTIRQALGCDPPVGFDKLWDVLSKLARQPSCGEPCRVYAADNSVEIPFSYGGVFYYLGVVSHHGLPGGEGGHYYVLGRYRYDEELIWRYDEELIFLPCDKVALVGLDEQ